MNTHTPGAWDKFQNLIVDDKKQVIASVSYRQDGYVQANARLIAAAPDLLEALKDVLPFAQRYCSQNNIDAELHLKLANDAIAKAKGDTP